MKIYIIKGSSGEYDDYNEWTVSAYISEERAKERLAFLQDFMEESGFNKGRGTGTDEENYENEDFIRDHENGDNHFYTSYTGVNYGCSELKVVE